MAYSGISWFLQIQCPTWYFWVQLRFQIQMIFKYRLIGRDWTEFKSFWSNNQAWLGMFMWQKVLLRSEFDNSHYIFGRKLPIWTYLIKFPIEIKLDRYENFSIQTQFFVELDGPLQKLSWNRANAWPIPIRPIAITEIQIDLHVTYNFQDNKRRLHMVLKGCNI